jgi:glucosyl-3-phosphoglycerate synthase
VDNFNPGFVLGLLGPLLVRDDVAFSKGFYDRPVDGGAEQGGRVTELMARPLITVLFPHLADLVQPLSGECAGRRDVLEALPFAGGYAVDLGLLIDVTARFGNMSLVQCDLGSRVHRNRPLSQLGPQSLAILQLALARCEAFERSGLGLPNTHVLARPGADPQPVELVELPPLSKLPANRLSA